MSQVAAMGPNFSPGTCLQNISQEEALWRVFLSSQVPCFCVAVLVWFEALY